MSLGNVMAPSCGWQDLNRWGVHMPVLPDHDDEPPACFEHSGTRPACEFRVLVWEAAADSAAADVGVLMALPLAPVL